MSEKATPAAEAMPVMYCANHPGRETLLRCNRCNKPICTDCAVLTEVGYRCRECVRGQRAVYFNGGPADLAIGAAVAFVLGGVVGALAFAVLGGFGFFSFIIAFVVGPVVGGLIAEAVRQAVGRRRSLYLGRLAIVSALLGILAGGLMLMAGPALMGGVPPGAILAALPRLLVRLDVVIFAVVAASTIYARLQ